MTSESREAVTFELSATPLAKVVHSKREPYDVYIGRPSKWGNPFVVGRDGDRGRVIERYDQWIKGQPELLASLGELEGKTLGCWCKPLACHGDVLKRLADDRTIERLLND